MKTSRKFALIFVFISMSIVPYLSASLVVLPPTTIDDYLETSEIIVIGRIGPVVKAFIFYGYQESAAELERLDPQVPLSLGLQFVDYEVIVDEVISTNGDYHREPLIVRVMRNHDSLDEMAITEDRGKFLMFLSKNPDDTTYGFYSFGHKVNIDDDERPMYYFGGELFDILDGDMSSHELISEVRRKGIP